MAIIIRIFLISRCDKTVWRVDWHAEVGAAYDFSDWQLQELWEVVEEGEEEDGEDVELPHRELVTELEQ